MALAATIYTFAVELADSDRAVYESLALRVARHPSESEEYLLTRVVAYALEFTEGIEFSRGLSEPDEPAISIRDLTGAIRSWIDIGTPDAGRLHKACKAVPRVAVYTHKDPAPLISRDHSQSWTAVQGLPANARPVAGSATRHELFLKRQLVFSAALERVRRKLSGSHDGDRHVVKILAAVLTDKRHRRINERFAQRRPCHARTACPASAAKGSK